jgi:hypothetical protein
MPVDESSMSDVAQKAISKLRQQIDVQKELIKKEGAVIEGKGDTYLCSRAKLSLENAERKLENAERKYSFEMSSLQKSFEQKSKHLEETYKQDVKKYEESIKTYEKIIEKESTNHTPTIIRAEKTIDGLREKVEKILNGWNTDVVLSDQSPATGGPIVDWASIAQQQLADMTPAERKFFEESKNRKPEPEVTYKYKGQIVSKFEYDRFIQQDAAEAYIKELYPEKKKEPRRIIRS